MALALLPCAGQALGLQDLLELALDRHARNANVPRAALVSAPLLDEMSVLRERQLPFYRAAMGAPLDIPREVEVLHSRLQKAAASPWALMAEVIGLRGGTAPATPQIAIARAAIEKDLWCASDPLAVGMRLLQALPARPGAVAASETPGDVATTWWLRLHIGRLLAAAAQAETYRVAALRQWPSTVTSQELLLAVLPTVPSEHADNPQTIDYRNLLPLIDWRDFSVGMHWLALATEELARFLTDAADLPSVQWQWSTPLGAVVVDTTGANSVHRVQDALLIVDVGGDDSYHFAEQSGEHRISLLLDSGGNDRYVAEAPGVGPGAAVLGYGILWDTCGNDRYEGSWLTQGAALFGAALHLDGGGDDIYLADGFSQGFALAGAAVLLDRSGSDRYTARTHSQACAATEGVALLMDTAGNDMYLLANTPLLLPSPQLSDRNVSMGQGAGRGERRSAKGQAATTGGMGILIDLQGDDRYIAQVFAQGAGYQQGVGLLIDGDGRDVYESAWYGMAAAAHEAVGILIDIGIGDDVYRASHSTSLAAAHDASAAILIDEGGNDDYTLGNLGLGAVNDQGFAVFLDGAGTDTYRVPGTPCFAFGIVRGMPSTSGSRGGPAWFLGREAIPFHCAKPEDGLNKEQGTKAE
jgi:hypothetical protein